MLAATTWAMPTKTELEQAQRLVQSLTADDLSALKAGSKSGGEVAAAKLALACSCCIFGWNDKIASKIGHGCEDYDSFRLVIGPDLLKEKGIKLPKLGK